MDCNHRIEVPLRTGGGKKMKKRRQLDALMAHSLTKRGTRRTVNSQDNLLSVSTDDPDDYAWMNVATSTRRSNTKKMYFRKCGPYLFGITTAIFVAILYWLYFDLRQQISDYRQRIEEVSAMSKIFPDTLQHWHETSSFLIKNQSFVICQLNDLTQSVGILGTNLSSLQAIFNAQRNYGRDEKIVADFGAKLEAVATDIEGIKEHFNRFAEQHKSLELKMEFLKVNMSQLSTLQANYSTTNFTNHLNLVNETTQNSLKTLQTSLMNVNNTMSQTIRILHEEILTHKVKLDDMLDRSQNITSHVDTLSNKLLEFNQKIVNMDKQLDKLKEKVSLTENKNHFLGVSVDQLMAMCKPKELATTEVNHENTNITETKENLHADQELVPTLKIIANSGTNATR